MITLSILLNGGEFIPAAIPITLLHKSLIKLIQQISESHA